MFRTNQTLLEQLRITEIDLEERKALFQFGAEDAKRLLALKPAMEMRLEALAADFHTGQSSIEEIALLIGDADTLARLRAAQRRYILDLFGGVYDLAYVNDRLRIGIAHKRLGVGPKLYLASVHALKALLHEAIGEAVPDPSDSAQLIRSLDKLVDFDTALVLESYVGGLITAIDAERLRVEHYARTLEAKAKEQTRQLEELSRVDPLTGLLNIRHLEEVATTTIRAAQRRGEPVTAVCIDVDDFRGINEAFGHQRGDDVLRAVGRAIRFGTRIEDNAFRYGGDEFCVVLSNCRVADAAEIFMPRLVETIRHGLPEPRIGLSYGVAHTGPDSYLDATTLIRRADEAMGRARQARHADAQTRLSIGT